ncbi:fructokinase-2 [Tanacetum coccineum]
MAYHPPISLNFLRSSSVDFHGTVGVFPVKEVDTTGAGDSFVGALLAKIVDDQSVLQMGRMYKPSVFDQLALDLINDWVEDMSRRPHSRLVASTYSISKLRLVIVQCEP